MNTRLPMREQLPIRSIRLLVQPPWRLFQALMKLAASAPSPTTNIVVFDVGPIMFDACLVIGSLSSGCSLVLWLEPCPMVGALSHGWILVVWLEPCLMVGALSYGWTLALWLDPGLVAGSLSCGWILVLWLDPCLVV